MPQTLAPGVASKTSACASSLNVVANQVQTFSSATVQPVEPSPARHLRHGLHHRPQVALLPAQPARDQQPEELCVLQGAHDLGRDAAVLRRLGGVLADERDECGGAGDDGGIGRRRALGRMRGDGGHGDLDSFVRDGRPDARRGHPGRSSRGAQDPGRKRSAPAPARASAGRLAARTMGSLSLDSAGMGLRPFADAEVQRTDVAQAWLVVGEEHLADELAPAADAGLLEDALEVLLHGVRRDAPAGSAICAVESPCSTSRVTSCSRSVRP